MNSITQDITSGETVYIVNRVLNNLPLNDSWSCYHGFTLDKASVKVTVPKSIGISLYYFITLATVSIYIFNISQVYGFFFASTSLLA